MIDEKSKKMLSFFESIMDSVYVIDQDFIVEYTSDSMSREFGQGVGKKCHQLLHQSEEICPWCRAGEVFGGRSVRWEHYISRIDRTFDLLEFPLENPDGTFSKISFLRDITEQIHTAERMRASVEEYKSLFEHVGCGVFISTKEGKFLDVNQALLDMLGYENKEDFL